jgi:pimeloyl-ACP methyl ester carboxylesterase
MAASAVFIVSRSKRAERDNPPLGQFIEIGGMRLHYVERGQGEPLVLLHGNGSMIQDFLSSGLVDALSRRYRVIVFDRPGYGYSARPRGRSMNHRAQADLIYRALRFLGVERPVLVGHSWGTLVAMAMALQNPSYVRSLVLMSGYYFPTPRLDVPVLSAPAIPVLGDVMRYTISPWVSRLIWPGLMRVLFGPLAVPQKFSAGFPMWMALRPSQLRASAAESALLIPATVELRRRYQELRMPITIVAGAKDRLVAADRHSLRLHRLLPDSELRLLPGMGHMIHQLATEEVAAAITAAAERSEVASSTVQAVELPSRTAEEVRQTVAPMRSAGMNASRAGFP